MFNVKIMQKKKWKTIKPALSLHRFILNQKSLKNRNAL